MRNALIVGPSVLTEVLRRRLQTRVTSYRVEALAIEHNIGTRSACGHFKIFGEADVQQLEELIRDADFTGETNMRIRKPVSRDARIQRLAETIPSSPSTKTKRAE